MKSAGNSARYLLEQRREIGPARSRNLGLERCADGLLLAGGLEALQHAIAHPEQALPVLGLVAQFSGEGRR